MEIVHQQVGSHTYVCIEQQARRIALQGKAYVKLCMSLQHSHSPCCHHPLLLQAPMDVADKFLTVRCHRHVVTARRVNSESIPIEYFVRFCIISMQLNCAVLMAASSFPAMRPREDAVICVQLTA